MYRVEWMKEGWKTIFWDTFSRLELAILFSNELKENEKITFLSLVTPWETTAL